MNLPSEYMSRKPVGLAALARLLTEIPKDERAHRVRHALTFHPDDSFDDGPGVLRAALANYWELTTQTAVPIREFRLAFETPLPIATVLCLLALNRAAGDEELVAAVAELFEHLETRIRGLRPPPRRPLLELSDEESTVGTPLQSTFGTAVHDLTQLIATGQRFPTIYADPPWPYDNTASRGAAENHYPTMSLDAICREPVSELAERNCHLHLWTTNGFLREAFEVMTAWGFDFKSCLVWVKDDLGMGNYWRVSHEFLLLGVRGSLTFRDRSIPSWVQARRTIHSRKPGVIRALIERVSPGPYLEMYGRESLPDSAWVVYGNRVEKRLF